MECPREDRQIKKGVRGDGNKWANWPGSEKRDNFSPGQWKKSYLACCFRFSSAVIPVIFSHHSINRYTGTTLQGGVNKREQQYIKKWDWHPSAALHSPSCFCWVSWS